MRERSTFNLDCSLTRCGWDFLKERTRCLFLAAIFSIPSESPELRIYNKNKIKKMRSWDIHTHKHLPLTKTQNLHSISIAVYFFQSSSLQGPRFPLSSRRNKRPTHSPFLRLARVDRLHRLGYTDARPRDWRANLHILDERGWRGRDGGEGLEG